MGKNLKISHTLKCLHLSLSKNNFAPVAYPLSAQKWNVGIIYRVKNAIGREALFYKHHRYKDYNHFHTRMMNRSMNDKIEKYFELDRIESTSNNFNFKDIDGIACQT